ncbi:MAG: hypothetical protein E6Y39_05400, partial [Clostridium butyricum]|nr:hypothetical protein [Clostridium butyricum]
DCMYISEPLSYFRIHQGQDQNNNITRRKAIIEWYNIINYFYENSGAFNEKDDYVKSLSRWSKLAVDQLLDFKDADIETRVKIKNSLIESLNGILNL